MAYCKTADFLLCSAYHYRRKLFFEFRQIAFRHAEFIIIALKRPEKIFVYKAYQIIKFFKLSPKRGCSKKYHRFCAFRNNFSSIICKCCRNGITPQAVCFIKNYSVPFHIFQVFKKGSVFYKINRADSFSYFFPDIGSCFSEFLKILAVNEFKTFTEFFFHLILPLNQKRRRSDYQNT